MTQESNRVHEDVTEVAEAAITGRTVGLVPEKVRSISRCEYLDSGG